MLDVVHVPPRRDLLGAKLPGHDRITIGFADGTWADDRLADDLDLIARETAAA